MSSRTLHLNVNLLSAGHHPAAWRWPAADPLSFVKAEHYVEAAKVAERGLFDAVFFADTPELRDRVATVAPKHGLDPALLLGIIARETSHIGLVATVSTSLDYPYNVARRFQSLDIISEGRAGWNVVTTQSETAMDNYGMALPPRAERYARAEEFVDVVLSLWNSWHEGAIRVDVAAGVFADETRIRAAPVTGRYFCTGGPLIVPRSPQGHPLIYQAGGSDEGLELAARTADVVFADSSSLDQSLRFAADLRARAARFGRDGDTLFIQPALFTTIGGTEQEARRRREELDALADRDDSLKRLAKRLGIDPDLLDYDKPVPSGWLRDHAGLKGSQGVHQSLKALVESGQTVAELARHEGRGQGLLVGTPEQVADHIENWFKAGAADGFVLIPDVFADGFPAFVDEVVPLLQRKGIYRTAYEETTLRGHYGL